MQMCNDKDRGKHALGQAEDEKCEDSRSKIEKEKGLRNTPPQVRKKKRKEPVKFVKKGRKHEEGSSKGKFEEDKARKKIELKCASVDDLISKLKAFKGALHNNKSLNTHLMMCCKGGNIGLDLYIAYTQQKHWKREKTTNILISDVHGLVRAAVPNLKSVTQDGGVNPYPNVLGIHNSGGPRSQQNSSKSRVTRKNSLVVHFSPN
ncbi:hypothetical protein PIB30_085810 [Stylosanthes scabra]|uniref:Uncharacterized protein n=1 Tax=Stylosanthes scabra TaxID=79078 RepID=A0ABU6YS56_9FABA|nr:hypothetical protein [Stylosanthes scabra]